MFLKLLYRLSLIGTAIGLIIFALTLAAGMISILLVMVEWVKLGALSTYWLPAAGVLFGALGFSFLCAFAADTIRPRLGPPAAP